MSITPTDEPDHANSSRTGRNEMIALTVSPDFSTIEEYRRDGFSIGEHVFPTVSGFSVNGRIFDSREIAERYVTDWAIVVAAADMTRAEIGDPRDGYSRDQYEAACRLVGIEPMTDAQCDSYGIRYGSFGPPEYTAEQIVSYTLASNRLRGIEAERKAASEQAQQAADIAAGTGGYSRGQYEVACVAAGVEPMTDLAARAAAHSYLDSKVSGVYAAGAFPADEVALRLAMRRADWMDAEAVDAGQVCTVCRRPVPAGAGVMASLGRVCDDQACYDAASA